MPGDMIGDTPVLSDRSIKVAQPAMLTRRFGAAAFGRYMARQLYGTAILRYERAQRLASVDA